MATNVKNARRPWRLSKNAREPPYIKLPLDAARARLAMVALRRPDAGLSYALAPRALLVGTAAAATHYNTLSRAIAVLTNKIFGIPSISYFDYFGAPTPEDIGDDALDVFKLFTETICFRPKRYESWHDGELHLWEYSGFSRALIAG